VKVIGLVGASGSGKTTLLEALLPLLRRQGVSVSTVKHSHHAPDIDQPGKDSWRHREAGAVETLLLSSARWALMHELHGAAEPALPELLAHMTPVDLVLVEGFKTHPFPKIEVHRPARGRPPLWPGLRDVVAVATDAPLLPGCDRTVLALNDPAEVARFALAAACPAPRG